MVKRGERYLNVFIVLLSVFFIVLVFNGLDNAKLSGHFTKTGTVYNCTNCSDCTAAIADASAGDTVQLNTSITNSTGTCINFADADNIIFDCMNYDNFIEGDDAGSDYGIYLTANGVDGSNNLIVRNCNVSDFEYGVYIESLNNTLVNITSTSNVLSGIYLLNGADNNSLSNANSSFNGEVGILISSSSNNNFTSCNIISNQIGVRFAPSSYNNTISDSLIKFSSEQGVYRDLINSDGNSLEDVNISSNKYGIYIEGSAVLPP